MTCAGCAGVSACAELLAGCARSLGEMGRSHRRRRLENFNESNGLHVTNERESERCIMRYVLDRNRAQGGEFGRVLCTWGISKQRRRVVGGCLRRAGDALPCAGPETCGMGEMRPPRFLLECEFVHISILQLARVVILGEQHNKLDSSPLTKCGFLVLWSGRTAPVLILAKFWTSSG